ncbi:MAG: hypothetical protein K8W52_44080 [Deltaproteobacteria bacterium]|nr:hypothetical protein [Deltaproteobacteria bacterium]
MPTKEGTWYRDLVRVHGKENVLVGVRPHRVPRYVWLRSTDELEPTSEEHQDFYDSVGALIDAFRVLHLPAGNLIIGPALVGDFFLSREEKLFFSAELLLDAPATLTALVDEIQSLLAARHPAWRVGYFAPRRSLLIYPDAVFLGDLLARCGRDLPANDISAWLEEIALAEREYRTMLGVVDN